MNPFPAAEHNDAAALAALVGAAALKTTNCSNFLGIPEGTNLQILLETMKKYDPTTKSSSCVVYQMGQNDSTAINCSC